MWILYVEKAFMLRDYMPAAFSVGTRKAREMAEKHLFQVQNGNDLKTNLYAGSMQQLSWQKAKSFSWKYT